VIEPRFRSGTFKRRIRKITRRAWGVSIATTLDELAPYMRGWRGYFGFYETPEVLVVLTRWVRLRLRAALWRQWKTPRRRRAALAAPRISGELRNTASSGLGPWPLARSKAKPFASGSPMPTSNRSAFHLCLERVSATSRTAVYGPVRTVVWEGQSREAPPIPIPSRSAMARDFDFPRQHCRRARKRRIKPPEAATGSRCSALNGP
jgi:Group II intron, maturase-specific domain